mgnify:CR=1 FL=1
MALASLRTFLLAFTDHRPADAELVTMCGEAITEQTGRADLPEAAVALWHMVDGEPSPALFPMLRLMQAACPTWGTDDLDPWLRILDELRLLGPSEALDQLEGEPLKEADPSWLPIADGDGNAAYLDDGRLIVWNGEPWDDPLGRGRADVVLDDLGEALAELDAAIAAGRFVPRSFGVDGWDSEASITTDDGFQYDFEWAAAGD